MAHHYAMSSLSVYDGCLLAYLWTLCTWKSWQTHCKIFRLCGQTCYIIREGRFLLHDAYIARDVYLSVRSYIFRTQANVLSKRLNWGRIQCCTSPLVRPSVTPFRTSSFLEAGKL